MESTENMTLLPANGGPTTRSRLLLASVILMSVSACAASGLSTATGPSRKAILATTADQQIPGVKVIAVNQQTVQMLALPEANNSFADAIGNAQPIGTVVGVGDALEVTIWEAPPALLFGGGTYETRIGSTLQGSRPGVLPDLVVDPSGTINIPFAGQVPAAGRSLRQIEQSIVSRLVGKAHKPQVVVRLARNATANVAVLGDVGEAGRYPLTPRGERLLDALALAGGTRQAVERMTVQVTRGNRTATMPLQDVVRDARQNIVLQSDDIVTALYQPYSFTVLGAAGKNEEVRFEGVGLSLSKALGRIGGLQDMRADPKGVFLFRWEQPERVRGLVPSEALQPGNPVPVIYRVDLREPQTYFAAQNFAMRDGDVMFVSNSSAADFQRFVNILASSVLPAVSVSNSVRSF